MPPDDGWAAFSGTSAAAPQVAGVCALLKQVAPRLSPAKVKDVLTRTARDATTGSNHPRFGIPAAPGYDLATGHGLVDAHRAVLAATLLGRRGEGQVITRPEVSVPEQRVPAEAARQVPVSPLTGPGGSAVQLEDASALANYMTEQDVDGGW